ncbi:hypothetical protein [Burkholderia plantarii]|uniref:hypothetical protein n=1 Tax=Burkholderia plantarii TaxID=41899 RepID=UPI0018DCA02B|nr:hypothetical protein [Burkholderia plantarii]MBI0329764.1 hypothetical protein [Burkholderia plantarii]
MSDSNSSRRFQHGPQGPRAEKYEESDHGLSLGFNFNLMSHNATYGQHKLSAKVIDIEAGVKYEKDNVRAFAALSTFGIGYESPNGNFKAGYSHSYGAGFGLRNDHAKGTSTFSLSPPRRKEAAELTLTHTAMKRIGESTFMHEHPTNNPFI